MSSSTEVEAQTPVAYKPISEPQKSPAIAALLSFFLLGGVGQIYLGQWKKGLFFIIATALLAPIGIGSIIWIIGVGDAYGTAQKLRVGNLRDEWKYNINWVVVVLAFVGLGLIFGLVALWQIPR